ncbi:MAG: hypothetical protein A3H06_00965 [Candidatus Colwellbacteria bacterium RIFCSPLOWO2_12_FULL_44_13]|uniref:Vitamin K epoxide reductase domain-containing protein n=1 Tax=Candidatus Colwellbacteria bacterium RIFCSPLOWO2_12_FULL_44_13 TaxID=1797694 RepID=A0A1G1Z8S2_9BACT|nr:MAG: hypothetical protein A3H06_00965 [Candidatus Colwellbacteria bacterium RIFCSPLOWO2_12_FULL_44_13]
MQFTDKSLTRDLQRFVIPRLVLIAFFVFSILGFLDATYLTAEHFLSGPVPCSIGNCETVLTSRYATIFGIPIALFGAFYYLSVFLGLVFYRETKDVRVLRVLSYFTILGFLTSLFLIYLQLFVIHAICIFCMVSALSSITLFALGMYVLYLYTRFNAQTSGTV